MKVNTFKIDDLWHFKVGDYHEAGFATKDAARKMGEKFLADKRKEDARARREARKAEKEE